MRKIWSSRKEKDRRKSLGVQIPLHQPQGESGAKKREIRDVHPIAPVNDGATQNTANATPQGSIYEDDSSSSVWTLARSDYDTKLVKNAWLNVIINSNSVSDINEHTLRMYRAELRGSHLYLYKASNSNIRSFRVTYGEQMEHSQSASSLASMATTVQPEQAIEQVPEVFRQNNGSNATIEAPEDCAITYFDTTVPHPQLQYDFETRQFPAHRAGISVLGHAQKPRTNSVEALLHFVLFSDDSESEAVASVQTILPMLPNFGAVLRLACAMVAALVEGRYRGTYKELSVMSRALDLVDIVKQDFCGYLLKSDVAPHVLRLVELVDREGVAERVAEFKRSMLEKQQTLIGLVTSGGGGEIPSPFVELNAGVFMNEVNLFDFAAAVSAIDLRFFGAWNSNIDKSLLLYSSVKTSSGSAQDFFYKKNPLIFNNEVHIHYLSRLLVHHLFESDGRSGGLERKARLLEKWIDLGCLLDKSGNMSSWLGISSVILSQPVLRLVKVWSLVSPDYIKLLKNDWSPVLFELDKRHLANGSFPDRTGDDAASRESYHIMAPRGLGKIYSKDKVIPYFGDLVINNTGSQANVQELEAMWKRVNYSFSRWNEYLGNLSNYTEIIRYNDDVLRRYDAMGFIFSNESLNQVLYLGSNSEEAKQMPPAFHDATPRTTTSTAVLSAALLRLIDANCDSLNLDKIMKLSLALEPELPEAYLRRDVGMHQRNSSSASLHSAESVNTGEDPSARLPSFNTQYFKVDMAKYDDLVGPSPDKVPLQQMLDPSMNKHNVYVDDELTFRIDDFVSEVETPAVFDEVDEVDDEDVPGLGIDVDDILNSDRFRDSKMQFDRAPLAGSGGVGVTPGTGASVTGSGAAAGAPATLYIPKFASIDKLIDLLLIDARYFDENITMDITEYRFVFLLNYNTFITTRELLDKLAHRFINSGNAVISVMKKMHGQGRRTSVYGMEFPNWALDTDVDLNELGEVDYELLLKIQINILKVLIVLVNSFYGNFALDLGNKTILIKLLKLFSNEILQWYNSKKIDATLEKAFESLVTYYKKLKKVFVKKTYRPIEVSKFEAVLLAEFRFSNTLHEVPMNRNLPGHKNVAKIEKFLYKFNKLLAVFYTGIKTEDWVKVFKILEDAFEKNALFEFHLQKTNTPDETLVVSNVFSMFESLVEPGEKQLVLKKFPLVFRKLFKIYFKFRSYLLVQLTDLNITVDERLDRMKTLLLMVRISQLKMGENQFVFDGSSECIPSCIETAITNVIYSPESRLFTNLWAKAANALNGENASYDDLASLLPDYVAVEDLQSTEPLLPCFGWIIELLLETNRCPSFHHGTVNFNKRYLIFKLIKELGVEEPEEAHHDTREFDFLLNLDETLVQAQSLRDFTFLDRDKLKLFRTVLRDQRRILILDNKKKQRKEVPATSASSSTVAVSAPLNKKPSASSLRRQSLSYKANSSSRFKISGLFNKTRPFSLGVSSNERVVSARELPPVDAFVEPKQKAFLVISLKNKKVFPVYLMPLCFKIDSDMSNDDYFFQAASEADLNDWMVRLSYANRHWFYSRALNPKASNVCTTFGIPIEVVCARENSRAPRILETIFRYIEAEGIKDVGIYRISSSLSELASVKNTIDRTGTLSLDGHDYDVHTLTSAVKSYFRELPDALLTDSVIEQFYVLKQQETEDEESYAATLAALPEVNYCTLALLVGHLRRISQHAEVNKMTASNLATVIGPALTEASSLDLLINNFGFMNSVMERLISYEGIFGERVEVSERIQEMSIQENPESEELTHEQLTHEQLTHEQLTSERA